MSSNRGCSVEAHFNGVFIVKNVWKGGKSVHESEVTDFLGYGGERQSGGFPKDNCMVLFTTE